MRILFTLLCTLLLTTACDAGQDNNIKKNLESRYPGIQINSVNKSPIDGLFEVVVQGNHIIYADKNANYIIDGMLVDTATKRNLTAEQLDKINAVNFDSLPLQDAIKIVKGNGKRRLAVFSDPDCPYCRRLQTELDKLNNVTIYIFEFPLAIHPQADLHSRLIWCSPDRAKAWDEMMTDGKVPAGKGDCANPIKANLALGRKLNIDGTPHIILSNGRRIPGLVPGDRLAQLVDAAEQGK